MKEEIEQRDIKAAAEKKRIEEEEKEASKIRAVDNALIDQQVKELKQPSKVVYKITDDLAKNILHKWEATRKFYISNVKNSFETMRN